MSKRGEGSDLIDNLLKFAAVGGVLSVAIVAPNAVQALDKPLSIFFRKMDKRQRERELQKTLRYMKNNGLLKGDYQHGLQITNKGRERIKRLEIDEIKIVKPKKWDKKWRIVMFDIPEKNKTGRDALTNKLKNIGFYQLQKSVWLHPYPCRKEIEAIASQHMIDQYVTYIETSFIDKESVIKRKFHL